jgi:hypothetical protein
MLENRYIQIGFKAISIPQGGNDGQQQPPAHDQNCKTKQT